MTFEELLEDIHALEEDLLVFERKYGVLSDTFWQSYQKGEEPKNTSWMLDWSEWAASYKLLQERKEQYFHAVNCWLDENANIGFPELIERRACREPVNVYTTPLPHIDPDIKHNRIPATEMSFTKPNLPVLIKEIG